MNKPFIISLILGVVMVLSSAFAKLLTPSVDNSIHLDSINLETLIPREFNGWKIDSALLTSIVNPEVKDELGKIYTQTLSRTYINSDGERVMLSIAYGRDQRTDLQVHRPEICYLTSGFDIGPMLKIFVETGVGQIPAMHMIARQGARIEPITYWVRMGDSVTRGWFEQKAATLRYMLTGKVPDGLLFRVSTISNDDKDSVRIQQNFVTSLLQAIRSEDLHWLVGSLAPS